MTETQLPDPHQAPAGKPPSPFWRRLVITTLAFAAGLALLFGLFVVAIVLFLFFGGGLKTGNK